MDPERRKFLKSSVLFFTASVQEEFHHGGGEEGYGLEFGLFLGIGDSAELLMILVKVE